MGEGMDRREFIRSAATFGGMAMLGGCKCSPCGDAERVPYGDTIGDRLWMWGHHRDSLKSELSRNTGYRDLPTGTRIDMAAACKDMNIPGCFVVRWTNKPTKAELPEYMKQFKDMKRVGFSITDSAVETFEEKVRLGFEFADKMPNLTSLVMDDFWTGAAKGVDVRKIARVREGTQARHMRLGVVLYADTNGVKSEYREVLDLCDEITFWFWHGKNVGTIEEQVGRLRDLLGADKPVLLGQYMYDFGDKKAMPGADMERQLAATSRLLSQKAIDGVIFHCTPLVDASLDAVNVSRAWIRENGSKEWGA